MSTNTPVLQFAYGNSLGYVTSVDGALYKKDMMFNVQSGWVKEADSGVKGVYIDPYDNVNRRLMVLSDGSVKAINTDNSVFFIQLPNGVTGVKSASMYGGYIFVVGMDSLLYVAQTQFWKTIKQNDWVKSLGGGINKILPIWKESNHLFIIDNAGVFYGGKNGWTSRNKANSIWQPLATGVIDAAFSNNEALWYIDRNNEIYCIPPGKWRWEYDAAKMMSIAIKLPSPQGSGGAIAIFANNSAGLGIVGKNGNVYIAADNLGGRRGSIYDGSIQWFKSGITNINQPVNDKNADRLQYTMVSISQSNVFMSQYTYTSLSNPLSNPYAATMGPSSLVTSVLKTNNNNAYPFKVLTLMDLIMMGRAMPVMREIFGRSIYHPDNVEMYCLTFTLTDQYLPLGDVLVYSRNDPTTTWCILVANNPQYSKPIPTQDILPVASSPSRSDEDWAYDQLGNFYNMGRRVMYGINSGAQTDKRYLKGSSTNFVIGDVVVNGNDKTEATTPSYYGTNTGSIKQGLKNDSFPVQSIINGKVFRIFASLNGNYIMNLPNATQKVIFDFKVIKGYKNWGKVMESSPFNTSIFVPDGGSVLNYVDFIPAYALAAMCGNGSAYNTLSKPNGNVKPILEFNCQDFMTGYMSENKYANILDKPSHNWCYKQDANCDDNLFAFCAADTLGNKRAGNTANVPVTISTADLVKTYPNSKNEICSCFMPTDYYKASSYNSLLGQYGGKDGPAIFNQMNPEKAFNIPECSDKLCHTNTAVQTYRGKTKSSGANCPSIGPICLNTVNLDLKSSKANMPINITQSNECNKVVPAEALPPPAPAPAPVVEQKVPSGAPPAPVTNVPPLKLSSTPITSASPPPSKMSPAMIVIIIVILVILLGGGAFFIL
jgi:hypothetical protein